MEVQEFGKQNSRKIMLLPGNMMSWRQFEAVIPLLEKQYPVIDTFAPDPEAKGAIWYGSNIIGHPDVMARDIIAFMKS